MPMGISMKASGIITRSTAQGWKYTVRGIGIMAISKTGNRKDTEFINGPTKTSTRESGPTEKDMARESSSQPMGSCTKATGRLERLMATVF